MDFGLSDEQAQLKQQTRRFLDGECPLERVRTIIEADGSHDRRLWEQMAALGWHALVVPEELGGLGLAWEDLIVVAEEMGRSLCPAPFVSNATAARLIVALGSDEQKRRWLPGIAAGTSIATLAVLESADVLGESGVTLEASAARAGGTDGDDPVRLRGEKMFVADAEAADLLLVAAREGHGVSVFAVPSGAAGVTVDALRLIDGTRRAARVTFDDVTVDGADRLGEAACAWDALAATIDAATVARCAEMVGAADAAVVLASDHAKVREQFGHPIGRFQGIKHTLAELYVGVESSRSLTYYAAWAVDNLGDARRFVSMAKARTSETLDRAGEECVQIHGAIGYTWECDAQLFYKRGRYSRNHLGSPDHHYERVLTSQGI